MASDIKRFNSAIVSTDMQRYLQEVLKEKSAPFVSNVTALVTNNAKLAECEPLSIIYAGIKATALDLPLDQNLGFAYVIPYNNTKENKKEAQFQIGYKGFVQLAMRSSQFKTINVTDIREGELVDWNILTGECSFQALPNRSELPIVGYAAYFKLTNGFEKTLYCTKEEVEAHAKRYSQTYASKKDFIRNSSKWTTDFDAMARKTVLKNLLSHWAPLSVEMQEAARIDQAVIDQQGVRYVDNDQSVEALVDGEIEECANAEVIDVETGAQVVDKKEDELPF